MMRGQRGTHLFWGAALLAALVVPAGWAGAEPVPITMKATDFTALGSSVPATAALVEIYNYNNMFVGTVTSQAFELTSGDYVGQYVYLYQADNYGPSVLENMGISPFQNIALDGGGNEEAGYLKGGEPVDFLAGGRLPLWMTHDAVIPSPVVSCNYPSGAGAHVPAGQHTRVVYLVSPNSPTLGEVYVIDSGVASVDGVVPVPEPAAAGLLLLGAGVAVLRRRRAAR